MNETYLIEQFWLECDDANFSKEATILFFYLLKIFHERKSEEIKMHPNKLSSVVKGFTPANVQAGTDELVARGYISYEPPTELCSSGIYKFVKPLPELSRRSRKQKAASIQAAQTPSVKKP